MNELRPNYDLNFPPPEDNLTARGIIIKRLNQTVLC